VAAPAGHQRAQHVLLLLGLLQRHHHWGGRGIFPADQGLGGALEALLHSAAYC
jgi:hypothetical protein